MNFLKGFIISGLMLISVAAAADQMWNDWKLHPEGGWEMERAMADRQNWSAFRIAQEFQPGESGAWLVADIIMPDNIDGQPTVGKPVGLQINAPHGGEIWVNGRLQMRFDNDHAGMALLSRSAVAGERDHVAIRVYRDCSDPGKSATLHEAKFVILEPERVNRATRIHLDVRKTDGNYPEAFIGGSQGAGLPDYEDELADRLKEIGIKWFRMDNILTNAVTRNADGTLEYDFSDLETRLRFMDRIGAEFIACVSYMPKALEAFDNPDRHAPPASWEEWEELCYRAAKHAIDIGLPIKYWEIWNEANSGWLKPLPPHNDLETYLLLYDASWRGIRRADPNTLIGGPCNASGPWDRSEERGYAVNGERYMRGLLEHAEKTGAPLDFISWHEYFHPPSIIREEAEVTREYMKDYPRAAAGVREFMLTEWNYAWWHDWPHDNEIGAAWTVNSVLRAMLPARIDRPFFFYIKDRSPEFRGEWGMLMPDNSPKAVFNAARLMDMMGREKLSFTFEDEELAILAGKDSKSGRVTVLLLNYPERYGVERRLQVNIAGLSDTLKGAGYRLWLVDKEHSNIFHDRKRSELEYVEEGRIPADGSFIWKGSLHPNSIALLELNPEY